MLSLFTFILLGGMYSPKWVFIPLDSRRSNQNFAVLHRVFPLCGILDGMILSKTDILSVKTNSSVFWSTA